MARNRIPTFTLKGGADISRAAAALSDMGRVEQRNEIFGCAAANFQQAADLWDACGHPDLALSSRADAERNWQAAKDKAAAKAQEAA
jgi:hypothetical protein